MSVNAWPTASVSPLPPPSRFSTNEGETWTDFRFSDREVYVYQLLTEPGEKSTIFTIFGSYADQRHSWLILQVNASDVLGRNLRLLATGPALVSLRLRLFPRAPTLSRFPRGPVLRGGLQALVALGRARQRLPAGPGDHVQAAGAPRHLLQRRGV